MKRMMIIAIGMALALGTYARPAMAVTIFHNCEQVCSSACELDQDVSCNTKSGISLTSGADLDLKGHSITCTASCPTSAVTMSGSGNTVKNTGAAGAGIVGSFTYNINCVNRPNSRVSGIKVENTRSSGGQGWGVLDCETIDGNVFVGHFTDGYHTGPALFGTGSITDNYITNWGVGIGVYSASTVTIDRNVVVIPEGASQFEQVYGVQSSDTVGTYDGNIFIGGGATSTSKDYTHIFDLDNGATGTFTNNFCDPLYECCQNCSSSNCANSAGPPTAPIVY